MDPWLYKGELRDFSSHLTGASSGKDEIKTSEISLTCESGTSTPK